MIEKTVKKKAVFHKPTGKWLILSHADAVYGTLEEGIEHATLFREGKERLSEIFEGVDFQFRPIDEDDFEFRDVEVTFRVEGQNDGRSAGT